MAEKPRAYTLSAAVEPASNVLTCRPPFLLTALAVDKSSVDTGLGLESVAWKCFKAELG